MLIDLIRLNPVIEDSVHEFNYEVASIPIISENLPLYEIQTVQKETKLSDEDKKLLQKCVEAEAGNQGYMGKVYVCDVILNRLDKDKWGDTIRAVIYYPNAFAVVSNGSIDKVKVSAETRAVVNAELKNRTNYEIISFKAGNYHSGLMPAFNYGNHYFSK